MANDKSIIKFIQIFYTYLGEIKHIQIDSAVTDELLFTIFFDTIQEIGGKEFLKRYVDEDAVFECILTTIKVGESYYTF